MNTEPDGGSQFVRMLTAYRSQRRPRRSKRIIQTPTGFVEIVFFSGRRAWVSIYDKRGWPSLRLTRWATRDRPSLARALQRGGLDAAEAQQLADEISSEWGEPMGDVAEVVIPLVTMMALGAVGAVIVGRWLVKSAGIRS